jgi:Fe2+ or Zn2+ uptake regulation protein
MGVYLQLPIQIQLLVDELQQFVKAARIHNAPTTIPSFYRNLHAIDATIIVDIILLTGSFACLFRIAHASDQDCTHPENCGKSNKVPNQRTPGGRSKTDGCAGIYVTGRCDAGSSSSRTAT